VIRLIQGNRAKKFPTEINSMFRARAKVFGERLGWDVVIEDGIERDEFDDANPLYLIQFDPLTGEIGGSVRMLPTSGPNMLGSCFAGKFDEPIDISSPLIWECTRFCVHPALFGERDPRSSFKIACEINLGVCEVGLFAGIEQIQAVYDEAMVRVYRKIGWEPEPMAKSDQLGDRTVYVGLWDVNESILSRLRANLGVSKSIIEPEGIRFLQKVA